jgi:hypothetical protein
MQMLMLMETKTTPNGRRYLREGLQNTISYFESVIDDPMNEETEACIWCYALASDPGCTCTDRILWSLPNVILLLQMMARELE